jgi:hypothetical protein
MPKTEQIRHVTAIFRDMASNLKQAGVAPDVVAKAIAAAANKANQHESSPVCNK